jgi:hypothetical protein
LTCSGVCGLPKVLFEAKNSILISLTFAFQASHIRFAYSRFNFPRYTAVSLMINRGIPTVVVSKILGHSKPSVALNIYAHCISELQYEAAKIMEEIATPIAIEMNEFPLKIEKISSKRKVFAPGCTRLHPKNLEILQR